MKTQKYIEALGKEEIKPWQMVSLIEDLYEDRLSNNDYEEDIRKILALAKEKLVKLEINLQEYLTGYIIKLATANGDLLYEEMHKLFSLRDNIHATEEMGFEYDENLKKEVDNALLYRFNKEPQSSTMVAQDKLNDSNRDLWWYKYNLGGRKAKKSNPF